MVVDIVGNGVVVNALPGVDALKVVFIVVDVTQVKFLLICCDAIFAWKYVGNSMSTKGLNCLVI